MQPKRQIPIWLFIGALLAVYGVMISGYGVIAWNDPPPAAMPTEIYNLHANVWWGALMVILGLFYVIKFWPSKPESLTGKLDEPPGGQK
jgi:hypothetical protein